MRYPLLALLLLSAHVAHAQLFGRMGGSSESPAFHPQGLPVTTVAPAYISRDDKPSPVTGFERFVFYHTTSPCCQYLSSTRYATSFFCS